MNHETDEEEDDEQTHHQEAPDGGPQTEDDDDDESDEEEEEEQENSRNPKETQTSSSAITTTTTTTNNPTTTSATTTKNPVKINPVKKFTFPFPTKQLPLPARNGFQLFAAEIKDESWAVSQYLKTWTNMPEEQKKEWNDKGELDKKRYDDEMAVWELDGGKEWNKRIRVVTERGVLPIKSVGIEMRKFPAMNVSASAVRTMTAGIELFIATMAAEALLSEKPEGTECKEVRLIDLHKLVYDKDARYGFLNEQFAPPSTLVDHVDTPEEEETSIEAAPAVHVPHSKPPAPGSKKRMMHRPALQYSTVLKLYEARNPNGVPFKDAKDQAMYNEEFKHMKDKFIRDSAQWRIDYPQEYEELLLKRALDREKSRKRKEAQQLKQGIVPVATQAAAAALQVTPPSTATVAPSQNTTTQPKPMIQKPASVKQAATKPVVNQVRLSAQQLQYQVQQQHLHRQQMQQQAQYAFQQQNKRSLHHPMQVAGAAARQQEIALNYRPVPQPIPQQPRRVVVDDPTIRLPWKRVVVLNAHNGIDDEYYWNQQTNYTSWERPQ
jgi:hypothetical protein